MSDNPRPSHNPFAVSPPPIAPPGGRDGTLATLSSDECYRLLATQVVGRLGVNAENYPLIFPVNYALDRGVIVIRTSLGTKSRAAEHANVSFEVDEIDRRHRSGWSVLVRGQAEQLTTGHDDDLAARTKGSGATPWAPGDRQSWIRLIPHQISGRRIVPDDTPAWFEPSGYL